MPPQDEPSFATTLFVRDACLCLHVQRAARALAKRFDDVLRPAGLTSGQFSLLMSLNRPQPPAIGDVSRLLAMDRTTLTANLKPLQRRGLIDVRIDSADKRRRVLVLTEAGRSVLAVALPLWQDGHQSIQQLLPDSSADRLRSDLRALV
jgi:DNA-binding MarR family transcriptional regulator